MTTLVQPLQWKDGELWILDQRLLPGRVKWIRARSVETVARAIETLAVRGAPVIGIAAAYGVALAARRATTTASLQRAIERLAKTRPTGRNLFFALHIMSEAAFRGGNDVAVRLEKQAIRIHKADERSCKRIARYGISIMSKAERVLTYCNTGALATGGIGTALGVIRWGYASGHVREVFACETRPVGQGARLTVWECAASGIPITLICDNMAAALMQSGRIDRVLVGADRITKNGDTSNKIGTLSLAVAAKRYGIPFHVVAPVATFDPSLKSGKFITIEERDPGEILRAVPGLSKIPKIRVWNPSFDVTPAQLISSYITDHGILHPPFSM